MAIQTKYAISAFIDLLGFSNHLELANNDTRTVIGEMAVQRLRILESVLKLVEDEKSKFSVCYPISEISMRRFNDAIFITMELSEVIQTDIGENDWKGWSMKNLSEFIEKKGLPEFEKTITGIDELENQSYNVAKFLGLVARIHIAINKEEKKLHFPGARTVISTGLKVTDDVDPLDDFSANFALSNAYIVGESGKKAGFGGNNLYVDDNIARIIALNVQHRNLLYESNIILKSYTYNPYEKYESDVKSETGKWEYEKSKPVTTPLFGKDYTFRNLNPSPLTWIQAWHYMKEHVGLDSYEEDKKSTQFNLIQLVLNKFSAEVTPIENIKIEISEENIFLLSYVSLDKDTFPNLFKDKTTLVD